MNRPSTEIISVTFSDNMAHLNKEGQLILTEDDKEALKGTRGVADRIMEKIIWGNKTPIYKTNNKNNGKITNN